MASIALRLVLALWLAVTFAALAGMWRLWLERERVLYLGKSIEQQRETVLQRAGIPPELARQTAELKRRWPADVRYQAKGDANALSYVTYLLIPRIPAKDSAYVLRVKGKELTAAGGQTVQPVPADAQTAERATPKGLILSFAVLLGWAGLIRKIWRGRTTWPEALALACLFFTLLVLPTRFFFLSAQPAFGGAIILALVGWATLLANALLSIMQKKDKAAQPAVSVSRLERIFSGVLLFIIAAGMLWSFLMAVVVVPADWDAWAIWGSKAKVLALGSGPLEDVTRFGHADYPLLWPTVWAFSGWLSGGWEECWSKGWGAVFLLLCVWEMSIAVRARSGSRSAGLLAAALFVSVPNVPLIASWAYAETPIWLMMTCGLTCFLRWRSEEGRRADAVLAGLFAAAAAHTKNEGLLFALLFSLLLLSGRQRKDILFALLAFTLCYLPWFWWSRLHLNFEATGLLHHWDADGLRRAASRIVPATKAIFGMWKDVRQWNIVGAGICLALIGTLLRRRPDAALLLLPTGLLTGYFATILFNANEICWETGTTWIRLTVQTLPLFLVLLAAREVRSP
ncbi:hypothetical protein [Candidatus Electronema sp. TJ]|uniref:hypothetical protein n=1 Tax=Candidatus Electronema sp. TJ TaxID=3401573 RepID=UPI003AA7E7D3